MQADFKYSQVTRNPCSHLIASASHIFLCPTLTHRILHSRSKRLWNMVAYSRCPFLGVDWNIFPVYVEAFVFQSCVQQCFLWWILCRLFVGDRLLSVSRFRLCLMVMVPLLALFLRKHLWGCNIRRWHWFTLLVVALPSPFRRCSLEFVFDFNFRPLPLVKKIDPFPPRYRWKFSYKVCI